MFRVQFSKSFVFSVLSLVLFPELLHAANRIVLKAEAAEAYVKERALDPSRKVQSYLFMKGRYYGGTSVDPGMDAVSFEDIVQNMAVHLRQQNFYPEPESENSDLLIVVHYGVTSGLPDSLTETMGLNSIQETGDPFGNTGFVWKDTSDLESLYEDTSDQEDYIDPTVEIGAAMDVPTSIDPGVEFNYNASLSMEEAHYAASFRKAVLLGMEEAFDVQGSPRDQRTLNRMINEERYFVVLNVFDFQKYRQGEAKLLWRMRYNIRSTGQSFAQAIQDMNQIAGDYYGTHHKGLVMKRISDKSRVQMGDIEVLESEETLN